MIKKIVSVCVLVLLNLAYSLTYAAKNPIKTDLVQDFPAQVFVAGGTYLAIYTFTNQIPLTLGSPLIIEKNTNALADFTYDDHCSGRRLNYRESCQVKIYFNPSSSGSKFVELIEAYGYNRVTVPRLTTSATNSSGGTLISGQLTTALTEPLVLNQSSNWKFTYFNEGSEQATGLSVSVTGSPAGYSTNCGTSLDGGSNCYVQGTLTPTAEGSYTVTAGLSYAQGATVYEDTSSSTSSSTGALSCIPAVSFGSQILINSTNQITLLCTNKSNSNITFQNTNSGSATLQNGSFSYTSGGSSALLPGNSAQNNCNSTQTSTLEPTQQCQLTGYYTAPSSAAAGVTIGLSVTYRIQGSVVDEVASTSTSTDVVTTINNSRTINLLNNCDFSVWWGMVGGAVSGSPSTCPSGSTLNNGRCLYNGFSPTSGGYLLAASGGTATTKIIQTDASTLSDSVLWKGVISGQTVCTTGSSCANNDCGSSGGTGQCTSGFQQPATEAEFTLLLTGSGNVDSYDITQVNGFSIPMSMSSNQAVSEYTCGTAGATTAQGSLPAANYTSITPPTHMYYWVSNLGSCTSSNTCSTSGQLCGLTFSASSNNFVKACGDFLGFWAANQICQTRPSFSSPFGDNFNCQQYLASPFPNNTYTLTQLLKCTPPDSTQPLFNSCYLSYPIGTSTTALSQCCGCSNWDGIASPSTSCPTNQVDSQWVDNVYPLIAWMKMANPTGYAYTYDDEASSFKCTASSSTEYTITFCPSSQTGLPTGITDGRG